MPPEDDFQDLEAALGAAYDEADTGAGDGTPPGTSVQPGERPASVPATTPVAEPTAAERARDEQGRFAKQGEPAQAQPQTIVPPTPTDGAAPALQPTSRIPNGLSPATKAIFATLPPHVQDDVLKLEQGALDAKTTWDQKAERHNRLAAVLDPRRQDLAVRGIDEVQAVSALFAAQDILEANPVNGILRLGQQFGVNWQDLFARLQGAPQQQQAAVPPGMEGFFREFQTLKQTVTQQQQAAADAARQGVSSEIQAFRADPKNLYFENVQTRMGKLIESGQATSLQDAYDQACWSDPQVRPLMMQASEAQRAADAKAAAAQKVAQARHASGSLTGSPTPGASPLNGAGHPKTLDDALNEAWELHS